MAAEKGVNLKTYQPLHAEEINAGIRQDVESYIAGFDRAFSSALFAYQKLQEESRKSDLKYVYICFLRSSISQHLPLYRINLYDEADVEDWDGCFADWDVPYAEAMRQRLPFVAESLDADKAYNLRAESLRREEAELFFEALKDYMPVVIGENRWRVPPGVLWFYGEYFDLCELVEWGED